MAIARKGLLRRLSFHWCRRRPRPHRRRRRRRRPIHWAVPVRRPGAGPAPTMRPAIVRPGAVRRRGHRVRGGRLQRHGVGRQLLRQWRYRRYALDRRHGRHGVVYGGTTTTTTTTGTGTTGTGTDTGTGTGTCDPAVQRCGASLGPVGCGSPPECSGDVLLCGILAEQWKTECQIAQLAQESKSDKLFDPENPGGTPGQIADGESTLNKKGALDINIFDRFSAARQSYLSYSGSCPSSKTVDFRGTAITIDTSALCDFGKFIRLILHMVAYQKTNFPV